MINRDASIDIIKFFAVFLIINSHIDCCYIKCSSLATGGAIGDALFLFCSGYTLFMKQYPRFDNWYKQRVNRIYPSVFASLLVSALLGALCFSDLTWGKLLGGEFVIAIMIYYCLLYLIRQFFLDKIKWFIGLTVIVTSVTYYFFPYKNEVGVNGIYGVSTLFRWIPYFGIMLIGAWIGLKVKNKEIEPNFKISDVICLFVNILIFYGIQLYSKINLDFAPVQIVTIPFLYLVVYYFWRCCHAQFFSKIYGSKIGNMIIMAVGGLCLESYLIQCDVITDKFNMLFPFNLPIMVVLILVVSYIVRCIARIIAQTFNKSDYDWKRVFAIV